jgi:phage tail sheath protein FI
MAFSISPAVSVREYDLSAYISNVSITTGALGGVFRWGPVNDVELISSEQEYVLRYGEPNSNNHETFFTGANYLAYSDKLYVSRAADANAFNAGVGSANTVANTQIKNEVDFESNKDTLDATSYFFAKYPGVIGNSLKVSVCDSANAFEQTLSSTANLEIDFTVNSNVATFTVTGANTAETATESNTINSSLNVGDYVTAGNTTIGKQYMKVTSVGDVTANSTVATFDVGLSTPYSLSSDITQSTIKRNWEYYNSVDLSPGTSPYTEERGGAGDQMHIVIVDEDGEFTKTPGQILEVFENASRATDARGEQGGSIYYKDMINNSSKYVWATNDRAGAVSNTAVNMTAIDTAPLSASFDQGTDSVSESAISLADLATSYDLFKSAEKYDISVILTGKSVGGTHGEGLANYIIDNICTTRKDCVAVISPEFDDVVNNPYGEVEAVVQFRQALRSTSYAFLDCGYKYQYDRYNDVYRWVPLNGDIAGTFSRTDIDRDPWWSPAGYNRGAIKNVTKLAFNPDKTDRDILYKNSINPVMIKGNRGPVLFGDKTLLAKTSAFDRINVRRLFIVLEKAIATAAEDLLFEFNDSFTRTQFRNLVNPYLRNIQGRRGIYEFKIVCDETNNTGEIIDNNQFIGDIYIKPAKSINEIVLNFVAVRTAVEFEEVVGQFG